jgi:L-asparagine permease
LALRRARPRSGGGDAQAINSVVFRIAVFYVGSLILLALLLPYTAYKQGTSPFVTFSSIGVPAAGDVMNFVVLTAALSSLNAGLYSTDASCARCR